MAITTQAGSVIVTQAGAALNRRAAPPVSSSWPPSQDDLRKRIGLAPGDTSRDADINAASAIALDLVEAYLDRKLAYAQESEDFFGIDQGFNLIRWPVDMTQDVKVSTRFLGASNQQTDWLIPGGGNGDGKFIVDAKKGIVHCPSGSIGWPMTIEYTGGFQQFPDALMLAMGMVFDAVWASDASFGGGGGGAQIIQGGGEIKSVAITGVGRIDYNYGVSSIGGQSGGNVSDPWGLIPANAISILDRFRSQSVIGVG